jgi:WhiB family redox-sensing transcriptional regulator
VSDWRRAARCRDEDPELFFPIGDTGPALLQIEEAKAVCRRCRVIDECRIWVDDHPKLTEHGIWGATTPEERNPAKARRIRHNEMEKKRRQRHLDNAVTGWA